MKKVLFITYYWPPSGKASIHWPLKMIKFLPEFGWEPMVLTAMEDKFSADDKSLLKDVDKNLAVLRTNSFEPFEIYRKFTGKKSDEPLVPSETISTTNNALVHKISVWIRMNLFIPDARAGWFFPAVKQGAKLLHFEKADAVVSIGPPHTAHLIGKRLSKKYKIPHVPVFIDPWVDIVYYKNFKRSALTLSADSFLEKGVLKNSKASVFVTETMRHDYIKKYNFLNNKSYVLYWGYDEDDFEKLPDIKEQTKEEVILHAGNIFDYQNPLNFWKNLKTKIDSGRKIKIKFIGTVSPGIKRTIETLGLNPNTEYVGFLTYSSMLTELMSASYLLVCATERRHVPGKLFEYLRTGKPIIAFGNDNEEVKKILEDSNSGMMFGYNEDAEEFFTKTGQFKTNKALVKKYDRKAIAAKLSYLLNAL